MRHCLQIFVIFMVFFVSHVCAKKLEIHRCVLANGTIAYQEKKCPKNKIIKKTEKAPKTKITTQKPMIENQQASKPTWPKIKPVQYRKMPNISTNDESILTISDQVKSYKISLNGLKKWGLYKKVFNNKLLHIKFKNDQVGAEMALRIDFIFPDNKTFSEDELTELVYLVGSQFSSKSQEGTVYPEKMNIRGGRGVMATFTNTNLGSEYKYTTKGAVFKGKWLIQFTMLSMNNNSYSHQYALQELFSSININQLNRRL